MYGYKNIDSLDLLTSDGRDIYHKVLDCTFQTSSLESYSSQKKIDLLIIEGFFKPLKTIKGRNFPNFKSIIEMNYEHEGVTILLNQ